MMLDFLVGIARYVCAWIREILNMLVLEILGIGNSGARSMLDFFDAQRNTSLNLTHQQVMLIVMLNQHHYHNNHKLLFAESSIQYLNLLLLLLWLQNMVQTFC